MYVHSRVKQHQHKRIIIRICANLHFNSSMRTVMTSGWSMTAALMTYTVRKNVICDICRGKWFRCRDKCDEKLFHIDVITRQSARYTGGLRLFMYTIYTPVFRLSAHYSARQRMRKGMTTATMQFLITNDMCDTLKEFYCSFVCFFLNYLQANLRTDCRNQSVCELFIWNRHWSEEGTYRFNITFYPPHLTGESEKFINCNGAPGCQKFKLLRRRVLSIYMCAIKSFSIANNRIPDSQVKLLVALASDIISDSIERESSPYYKSQSTTWAPKSLIPHRISTQDRAKDSRLI